MGGASPRIPCAWANVDAVPVRRKPCRERAEQRLPTVVPARRRSQLDMEYGLPEENHLMKRATLALIALAAAGCATLRGPSDAQLRYEAGVQALARQDYAAAAESLEFASRSGDAGLARRAQLLLAAVRLDPLNPNRDPESAAQIADGLRSTAEPGSVEAIAAETFARVARDIRDIGRDLDAARGERDRAWAHIDSLSLRANGVQSQRDSLQRRALRLEQVGDSLEAELKKTTQELERIRRAIRG